MGANDAQEMLDAAKAQAILDERQIAALERRIAAVRRLIATSTISLVDPNDGLAMPIGAVEVWRLEQILDAPDDTEQERTR